MEGSPAEKGLGVLGVKSWTRTGSKGEMFYAEGGETLAQVVPRGGRCPIPGHIPGEAGRGSERPDQVGDVPAHGRGWDWMSSKGPFQPKPFCDSVTPR